MNVVAVVSHLAGQLLILLHQLLILLVDGQHLADTIGSCLSLRVMTLSYIYNAGQITRYHTN